MRLWVMVTDDHGVVVAKAPFSDYQCPNCKIVRKSCYLIPFYCTCGFSSEAEMNKYKAGGN